MARTMMVEVDQVGASTSKGAARTHSVLIDRPADKGGDDRGPLGGELLLLSLGGCFMSTLLAAARTRDAALSGVKVTVTGTVGGVPERFESLHMRVSAQHEDRDLLRKLITLAERGCLVTNTLRDAAVVTVELAP
ncbi:MAG: OsmC family protein [Vicinamibacterales bacterium]|nr:OsmC family protein [Vicinamibacterales bacterium]